MAVFLYFLKVLIVFWIVFVGLLGVLDRFSLLREVWVRIWGFILGGGFLLVVVFFAVSCYCGFCSWQIQDLRLGLVGLLDRAWQRYGVVLG